MLKIGIIAASATPYHKGHHLLHLTASQENDTVLSYISTSDRIRKGEVPIHWHSMKLIWDSIILPSLPQNITVNFTVNSPVTDVWNLFDKFKDERDVLFRIYGDPLDNQNRFNRVILQKYVPTLFDKIELRSFDRSLTNGISGTMMRMFLKQNNKKMFISNLPFSNEENEQIWKTLKI